MEFIQDSDKKAIREKLEGMRSEVSLIFFTQEEECDFCRDARELLEELSTIDERIKIQIHDFKDDKAEVEKYKIDKIPATVVANGKDFGIRFYGLPAGYEFSSLLDAILMVSKGESELSFEAKKALSEVKTPLHLQVFVTPT
jgi:glutaredoxin-like protein